MVSQAGTGLAATPDGGVVQQADSAHLDVPPGTVAMAIAGFRRAHLTGLLHHEQAVEIPGGAGREHGLGEADGRGYGRAAGKAGRRGYRARRRLNRASSPER